jgi:glucose/arabinose dehydrogenase/soluble lytic murein transglycosylase-like protein
VTRRARVMSAIALAVVVIGALIVFRGRDSGSSSPQPRSTATAPSTTPPPSSATLAQLALSLTKVASVRSPTAMTSRVNDTSLYVVEQDGRVQRLRRTDDSFTVDGAPVVDITGDVQSGGEQGLLGIAFSKDGSRLYLAFTNRDASQQVDEFAMSGDAVVAGSRRTLLVVPDFAPNHNGGDLVTGPDGFLYYTMGDGGGGGDPRDSGQDPGDLLGNILRIDPSKPADGKAYGIPADNPFAKGGGAPEVWQYGLRNPWRFSFDRETSDIWIADVGQNAIEEVDFLPAGTPPGQNFGWSAVEGTHPFKADGPPAGAVGPIYEYDHSDGRCSITGGYVYRGKAIPSLASTYLFADYCQGEINGLVRAADGSVTVTDLHLNVASLSSFGEDNDGEIYVLGQSDGSVSRIDQTGSGSAQPATTTTTAPAVAATLSPDPTTAADQLVQAEQVLRDPAASNETLTAAAHLQQLAYRRLGRQPELFDMIVGRAPAALQEVIRLNLLARDDLAHIPGGPLRDTLPAWRIVAPASADDLVQAYQEGEQRYGVGWNYLASINLIESALGRIQGFSSAGAQGPMQFMPSTWDAYGDGDINSPHDSIIAAARYLNANGFADGNVDGALFRYNNSTAYVSAVKDIAQVLALDPAAFAGYYRWEVYYVTTLGDVLLPVGYATPDRIPAADYIAAHPQEP